MLGFLHAEPNFNVSMTVSRNILIINPEPISSNQDTGTNRGTACQTYFAPSADLALNNMTPPVKALRLEPIHFQDVRVP